MSRLYASIDSDARKTQATSRGHKSIEAHVRGWNAGIEVTARVDGDADVFDVFSTSGSNGGGSRRYIGTLTDDVFTLADRFNTVKS